MKIVLVRPPFYALFGVTAPKMKTYPLNLLYLATYVRDVGGHDAAVVDGEDLGSAVLPGRSGPPQDPGQAMHEGIPRMLAILKDEDHPIWKEAEGLILAEKPDVVGITCNSGNMDTVRVLVNRLKKHGLKVVLGGSHPTALPEQSIVYAGADAAVAGEGEAALLKLMEALEGNTSLSDVPSLAWRGTDGIVLNPRGRLLNDIDALPIPDRSFINRAHYFGEVVITGRGCPFDCAYCASRTIWGRRVRLRSVPSIVEELLMLRDDARAVETAERRGTVSDAETSEALRPGRWVVKVVDDTFTVNRKRTLALLDAIIENGLTCFEFTGGVRADTLTEELVYRMREANFRRVTLGVESGSPRMLELIRKGETNEDVKRAVDLLRKAGIRSHAFFMIGLPEETPEDIELSKQLIRETRPDHVEINMVTPYPGTDIFNRLIPEDPRTIDRWYRWFHQGMATHSERLGYDLDRAYEDFLEFAREYHASVGDA